MKKFTKKDAGCWLDSARGRYIGEEVINIAEKCGMKIKTSDKIHRTVEGEFYDELWDEAENFLNSLAPNGFYFGSQPDTSDWGLWQIEKD